MFYRLSREAGIFEQERSITVYSVLLKVIEFQGKFLKYSEELK